ncbi:MAG: hypothetical protein HOP30_02600 [Cyclobacteriaceae bacterium]|nr:hypothetical protein [Cyclobacteriaceae bacterium]
MELDEMKNVWRTMDGGKSLDPHQMNDVSKLEYTRKASVFTTGEVIGLVVAYTIAGLILYQFKTLDDGYLLLSGYFLVVYLLIMPLYTLFQTWKMKHIDLGQSSYKEVLEHFYTSKNNLKKAEKISLIASPILFLAAIAILTKLFTDKNLFTINIQWPVVFLIGIALLGAIFFNIWAFKKRDQQFKSINELLEEEN